LDGISSLAARPQYGQVIIEIKVNKRGPRYQGGGKRRGVIAASVVNNKPQMSADYFSMLQFVVSNLAFAATVLYRTKKCCTPRWRPPIEAASFFLPPPAAGSGGWPN
jgi:hypothetical protein